MKEDMEKIFGKEFSYLKRLSCVQLLSLVWFVVSLFLTALLADVSLLATLLSAVSMFLSIASHAWSRRRAFRCAGCDGCLSARACLG